MSTPTTVLDHAPCEGDCGATICADDTLCPDTVEQACQHHELLCEDCRAACADCREDAEYDGVGTGPAPWVTCKACDGRGSVRVVTDGVVEVDICQVCEPYRSGSVPLAAVLDGAA
ncbi:hypothetical protein [Nocardioides speluncae]|uniref:hypothetical protein n=1 Tax=Nocardioides speluncae TaxID=2670337 RepID=UPI000D69AD93|nr:hypothetical protein [Nocardioides speluncae]